MNTKDIIFELRTKNGLSQDELAEKLFVKNLTCDCSFITHHTITGVNLTGANFLQRKDKIIAALDREIKHGDMDIYAAIRSRKSSL